MLNANAHRVWATVATARQEGGGLMICTLTTGRLWMSAFDGSCEVTEGIEP
jgi:hypothetical protein